MLEKMGWTKGKGLGANEDGNVDFVRVKYKCDSIGIGYEDRDDGWTQHEQDFEGLLNSLNSSVQNSDSEKDADGRFGFGCKVDAQVVQDNQKFIPESLEQKSKKSRARVHYKKFTKGKDISQYSEKDLANIFGRKALEKPAKYDNEAEKMADYISPTFGVQIINTGTSINDYFKSKLKMSKHKHIVSNEMNNIMVGEQIEKFEQNNDNHEHFDSNHLHATEQTSKKKEKHKLENSNINFKEIVVAKNSKKKKKHTDMEETSETHFQISKNNNNGQMAENTVLEVIKEKQVIEVAQENGPVDNVENFGKIKRKTKRKCDAFDGNEKQKEYLTKEDEQTKLKTEKRAQENEHVDNVENFGKMERKTKRKCDAFDGNEEQKEYLTKEDEQTKLKTEKRARKGTKVEFLGNTTDSEHANRGNAEITTTTNSNETKNELEPSNTKSKCKIRKDGQCNDLGVIDEGNDVENQEYTIVKKRRKKNKESETPKYSTHEMSPLINLEEIESVTSTKCKETKKLTFDINSDNFNPNEAIQHVDVENNCNTDPTISNEIASEPQNVYAFEKIIEDEIKSKRKKSKKKDKNSYSFDAENNVNCTETMQRKTNITDGRMEGDKNGTTLISSSHHVDIDLETEKHEDRDETPACVEIKDANTEEGIYIINSYIAEKFRYVDLNSFSGSNIGEIIGYGLGKDINLKIVHSKNDSENIAKMWEQVISIRKHMEEGTKRKKSLAIKRIKKKNLFKYTNSK